MIRRPPRSTLFPTRRSSDLGRDRVTEHPRDPRRAHQQRHVLMVGAERPRSEEHTSELQSLRHLVCRLLLEKKKKKKHKTHYNKTTDRQKTIKTEQHNKPHRT